jgi:hypothetical protein
MENSARSDIGWHIGKFIDHLVRSNHPYFTRRVDKKLVIGPELLLMGLQFTEFFFALQLRLFKCLFTGLQFLMPVEFWDGQKDTGQNDQNADDNAGEAVYDDPDVHDDVSPVETFICPIASPYHAVSI